MVNPIDELEVDTRSMSSGRQVPKHVHKVSIPPKQKLFSEIKAMVKETLFSDDPLRPFKDQPGRKRLILGVKAVFLILNWGWDYNLTKFKGDLITGLTIASLCIPQVDGLLS